ncbi:hypothetical protein Leryth_004346 [Lithospermum erythrorhizon]|nr:hypothetical protein Leryth_004346 [Lithospermum erythrorhizon]
MDIDFPEYKLRCQLRGHEDDARGICICGNTSIATSSRDGTIRHWTLDQENNRDFSMSKILVGHTGFVGPLAWITPNDEFPEGGVVSGGMDKLVLVWNLATGEKVNTLKGHKGQVTGVTLDGSDIVSASVDRSLRRWTKGQLVDSWEAHDSAVQAILKLPSGELVTGSSDWTLKFWKGKTCVNTFKGHTDTVRGLAVMPNMGIVSASHDGLVRLWSLDGEVLLEMVGHTNIVYSVHAHENGLIVSGSEDCSAKIWKDGVCIQSIEHPGCVWDVKLLGNGDIVTACSDGIVRVWTVHQDKLADTTELETYASQISQYKISRKRVGGLKLEELPGLEALQSPGTQDGQTKVVRVGENGVAYSWNLKDFKWDKIGEVVDGPVDSMKRSIHDGIQYDYVFDVDIGDGEPVRKLPYNRSDNPYDTAEKWLMKENLPLSYREQVVAFIMQNTGQKDIDLNPSFRDPYTGSSAYVPGQPSNSSASASKPKFKHIPKKGMLVFDAAQFDGILKKILEFNETLFSDSERHHLSFTEVDTSRVSAIITVLKDTSHYHCSKFSDIDVTLVLKMLTIWPNEMLFPVIDVLRMMILHPDGATVLLKHVDVENDIFLGLIKRVTENPLPANVLTCIRVVTNLFKSSSYHGWLQKHRGEILDAFSNCSSSSNKNIQLSYSTLILNYAVLLIEKKDEEGQSQVLSAALVIAEGESLGSDSEFRALVTIGSLMVEGLVRKIALDFDVDSIAQTAKASKDEKISEVGADIELIIKQG